jgi:hypothetical protein
MKFVKGQLILNLEQYQQRACHSQRESTDVDERVHFALQQVSYSDFEVALEQGSPFKSYQCSVVRFRNSEY